jgi:hypothetical protein
MREDLFKWIKINIGEVDFMGHLEYTESTIDKLARDNRVYRITEIKLVIGLPFQEVSKARLERWQKELMEILQVSPVLDRFNIEADQSKRMVTPGEIENRDRKIGALVEKESLLLRINVFKKRQGD